jgi:uncharacterized protein YidB (DUF937 family)
MGLLDDILKSSLGGESSASAGKANSLVKGVLDLLDDPDMGGVSGLQQSFDRQGLGDVVSSWIGTGANRSITGDQVTGALGRQRVDQIARSAGLSAAVAPAILASVLPALIDKLTPDGQVPQQAALAGRGKSILESITSAFGGAKAASAETPRPKADFSGVQAGSSSTAAAPKAAGEVEIYVVVAGDSLSKISKRYYDDANAWRRIYDANKEVIGANPDLIRPGQKLRIPKKS